jgi:hypothetical protein
MAKGAERGWAAPSYWGMKMRMKMKRKRIRRAGLV